MYKISPYSVTSSYNISFFASITSNEDGAKTIYLQVFQPSQPRIAYGVSKLKLALESVGYKVLQPQKSTTSTIWIGTQQGLNNSNTLSKKESFRLFKSAQTPLQVIGFDESGVLYGCLELAERIKQQKTIPQSLVYQDQPEMVLRGTCVGTKTHTLPDREVYEYPYTEKDFLGFTIKTLD
jgi:hypothetical protein